MIEFVGPTKNVERSDAVRGVSVQYSQNAMYVGVGVTLNREGLEKLLAENPERDVLEAYVSLERPQVNRLVRLLRKARDLSFGRDE